MDDIALTEAELRGVQLELLDALSDHCRRHGLRFYLCAGTLLGAVRHEGYIPWDDDIDVMMPRTDYQALVRHYTDPLGRTELLSSRGPADSYPYPYAKLADRSTVLLEEHATAIEMGVNIDVFPLDGWPSTPVRLAVHRARIALLHHVLMVKASVVAKERSTGRDLYLRVARRLVAGLGVGQVVRRLSRAAERCAFDDSSESGVVVWGYHEHVPTHAYAEPSEVTFEGRTLPAPRYPDTVLTCLFGDYRTLPDPQDRVSHHAFTAYRRASTGTVPELVPEPARE